MNLPGDFVLPEAVRVFVGMGSNLGERERLMQGGLTRLIEQPEIEMLTASSLYETDPVGYLKQPLFLNAVVCLQTVLPAPKLLQVLLETEKVFGRKRRDKWGPRTLDLDLLYYGDLILYSGELILPHPRMMERAFVLWPLLELKDFLTTRQREEVLLKAEAVGQKGIRYYRDPSWALSCLA